MPLNPGQQLTLYLAKADLLNKIVIVKSRIQKAECMHKTLLAQKESHSNIAIEYSELQLQSSINLREQQDELDELEEKLGELEKLITEKDSV